MRRRWVLFAIVLFLQCSPRTAEEKLLGSTKTATAWDATLPFVAHQWLGNRVPQTYARRCAVSASVEIDGAIRAVDRSSARSVLRTSLRHELDAAAASTASLERAFARGDRTAIAREAN